MDGDRVAASRTGDVEALSSEERPMKSTRLNDFHRLEASPASAGETARREMPAIKDYDYCDWRFPIAALRRATARRSKTRAATAPHWINCGKFAARSRRVEKLYFARMKMIVGNESGTADIEVEQMGK